MSLASLLLLVAGCPALVQESASAPTPVQTPAVGSDPIVIRVDGAEVTRTEYEDWLLLQRGELDAPTYARVLALRIRAGHNWMALSEAQLLQDATQDVEERLAEAFGGDRDAWIAELMREGRTPKGVIAERAVLLEPELYASHLMRVETNAVGEQEIQGLWEERYGPGGKAPVVRLLRKRFVVPFAPGEDTASRRTRTEELRNALHEEMAALVARGRGGEAFETLVRAESDHPSKADGGRPKDDGWRRGMPLDALRTVVDSEAGSLSEPIFAQGAFWILRLEGVHETPYDSVRQELLEELQARGRSRATELLEGTAESALEFALAVQPALLDPTGTDATETLFRAGQEDVRRGEYARWLRRWHGEREVTRFALERRLRTEANAKGLVLDAQELEQGLARARATAIELEAGGDEVAWLAAFERRGLSEASWRRGALRRLELEALEDALARAGRTPTEDELRLLWERQYGPEGLRRRVRWIQLRVPSVAPETPSDRRAAERERLEAKTLERARALRAEVEGGAEFAALAREHSDDAATSARGGAPADDFRIEGLPPEVLAGLDPLAVGEVAAPILLSTKDSVVLIQLVERVHSPFDTVRADVLAEWMRLPATLPERAALRARLSAGLAPEVSIDALIE